MRKRFPRPYGGPALQEWQAGRAAGLAAYARWTAGSPYPFPPDDYGLHFEEGWKAGWRSAEREKPSRAGRAEYKVARAKKNPASAKAKAKYHRLVEAGDYSGASRTMKRIHAGLKGSAKRNPERARKGWHGEMIPGIPTMEYRRNTPDGRYLVGFNPDAPGWHALYRPTDGRLQAITAREGSAVAAMKKADKEESARPRVKQNPPRGGFALVRGSGMSTKVVSLHENKEAAITAMKKKTGGYGPDSLMTQGYHVYDVGPSGGWEVFTLDGKKEIRPKTRWNPKRSPTLRVGDPVKLSAVGRREAVHAIPKLVSATDLVVEATGWNTGVAVLVRGKFKGRAGTQVVPVAWLVADKHGAR